MNTFLRCMLFDHSFLAQNINHNNHAVCCRTRESPQKWVIHSYINIFINKTPLCYIKIQYEIKPLIALLKSIIWCITSIVWDTKQTLLVCAPNTADLFWNAWKVQSACLSSLEVQIHRMPTPRTSLLDVNIQLLSYLAHLCGDVCERPARRNPVKWNWFHFPAGQQELLMATPAT